MSYQVRAATVHDVNAIFHLTNDHAQVGLMLPRSKYKIITMLNNFSVVENAEKTVVACAALTPLWTDMAEIMALAVADEYQGLGIGTMLCRSLIRRASDLGFPKVIALTYQVEFFKKIGFSVTDKDQFPRKMWRECLECPKLEHCDETAMFLDL